MNLILAAIITVGVPLLILWLIWSAFCESEGS